MATSDSPMTGIYMQQVGPGRNATMGVDDGGTLDITSGKIQLPGSLGLGYMSLGRELFGARETASNEKLTSGTSAPTYFWGGLLLPDTTPSLDLLSTAIPIMRLQWVSGNVDSLALPPVALPQDMATAGGMTIGLYGETIGSASAQDATDALTVNAIFDLGTDVGTTAPAFTSTPGWKSISISSANITTGTLNLRIFPQTHAAQAITLYNMRATYTKRTS